MEVQRQKNVAAYFVIPMIDKSSPESYKTGESVTDTAYYNDGSGVWTSLPITDIFSEIGSTGLYEITLTAAEMNHDQIIIKLTATNSQDNSIIVNTLTNTVIDNIANKVWDEARTSHTTSGSFGETVGLLPSTTIDGKSHTDTLKWILAFATGKINRSGNSYAYRDQTDTADLFTLTASTSARTRA